MPHPLPIRDVKLPDGRQVVGEPAVTGSEVLPIDGDTGVPRVAHTVDDGRGTGWRPSVHFFVAREKSTVPR